MKFNSEIFKQHDKCFRLSWEKDHFLTYDGENFIEHFNGMWRIWYWDDEDFENAIIDLNAEDWRYSGEDG